MGQARSDRVGDAFDVDVAVVRRGTHLARPAAPPEPRWVQLRSGCPRLRSVSWALHVHDQRAEPWPHGELDAGFRFLVADEHPSGLSVTGRPSSTTLAAGSERMAPAPHMLGVHRAGGATGGPDRHGLPKIRYRMDGGHALTAPLSWERVEPAPNEVADEAPAVGQGHRLLGSGAGHPGVTRGGNRP